MKSWLAFLTVSWTGVLGTRVASQEQDEDGTRFFALPMSRDARDLAAGAEEHLAAARFDEALFALQRLIEEHRAEVLPRNSESRSEYAVHSGAAEWARKKLLELPAEARRLYLEHHQTRAAEALRAALAHPTRRGLVDVARRWPIVPAAARAWWCLGDLELESGQRSAALESWEHAREIEELLGHELPEDALARFHDTRAALASLGTGTPAEPGRGALPRAEAQPWTTPLDLTPFTIRSARPYCFNLFPGVCEDRVLVSSSLRLYALDLFTGEVLWQAGPPSGWARLSEKRTADLFEGINFTQSLIAPAASGSVALAVLQVPFSENSSEEWQGIEIMKPLPERRLFAFALEDGRPLWDHAPPLQWDEEEGSWAWDGTSGTYAQRMMVAAPPTIAGSRVLVPCYRERGRIDYHVACYELESGEFLWSTAVVSGQRERNMFGRAKQEFAASTLVVAGERVIAQTELGTVAALDLVSGRILWQSLYRQIDLPKTRSYNTPQRDSTWRLSPPVVAGEFVLSTPFDSRELYAFRLQDGSVPWAVEEEELQRLDRDSEHLGFSLLVGADGDTLFLSGGKLAALQKPGGFSARSPFVPRWTYVLPREHEPAERAPRPILCRDAVLVPTTVERIALERRTGERLPSLSAVWKGASGGNTWVENGALFTLSDDGLSGYFDWDTLLERARATAERALDDPALQLETAELFLRRGLLARMHDEAVQAVEALRTARIFLERVRHAPLEQETARRVREEELRCLRELAGLHERSGDPRGALEVLQAARELCSGPGELRDVLLQEERCLRDLDPARRLEVLDELLERCADLPLPPESWKEAGSTAWLAGEERARTPGEDGAPPPPLTIDLWVRLERAGERAARGDLAGALEDLHLALARHGTLALARGIAVRTVVHARITRLLSLPGGRPAYAAFEERAAELLSAAREAGDTARLEQVAALYPHSRAAELATAERLERALADNDVRAVAAIVCAAVENAPASTEGEARLLLRLARALGQSGNAAFERGLVTLLAREFPGFVSDLPGHEGRTLAELARDFTPEEAAPRLPPRFDQALVSTGRALGGSHEFLGVIPPLVLEQESGPHELHAYLAPGDLRVFSSQDPAVPLWTHGLVGESGASLCALARGRVLFADKKGLHGLDETGADVWVLPRQEGEFQRLVERDGVGVARSRERLLAFDAWSGIPLWERSLGDEPGWAGPVSGPGVIVLLSQRHALPALARVIDLFRGRVRSEFELPEQESTHPAPELATWIEHGHLIVPAFETREPSSLSAFSLDSGRRAWSFEFGPSEELYALAECEGKVYAITVPVRIGGQGNGGVYLLDTEFGSARQVVPLEAGEEPMGIPRNSRTILHAPYLFTFTRSETERGVPVRAIHLPYGTLWTWSLPVTPEEFYDNRGLPMPAVSADCVAIAYQTRDESLASRAESKLVLVDKRAGKLLGSLVLDEDFGFARTLELRGLGDTLFVSGRSAPPRGLRLEILEKLR